MSTALSVIPSASRLMASLRDIGYDLPSAVADLVDNSIDAGAPNVRIDVEHRGASSYVRVADDGIGMTAGQLDEAMRYGSRRAYGATDLGKFGLGLKTASLSHCRRLTVATRTSGSGRVHIRRWDLDDVDRRDEWHLQRLGQRESDPQLVEPLRGTSGTVVMWEKLDRVLAYRRPDGEAARARLDAIAGEIAEHGAMVFHRFLSGEAPGPRLRMTVNGNRVTAWDPFARTEAHTRRLPRQTLSFADGDARHRVRVQPYILPNQHQFSGADAHALAGGPGRWNRQQGLYIYRRDRLVQSGGWNRLRTMDEHSKLARIAVHVPFECDASFRINVSKMAVTLPDELRPKLRTLVAGVVSAAQDVYRQRGSGPAGDAPAVDGGPPSAEWTLGDRWGLISRVLHEHLSDEPERLRAVLLALVNRPELIVPATHAPNGNGVVDVREGSAAVGT